MGNSIITHCDLNDLVFLVYRAPFIQAVLFNLMVCKEQIGLEAHYHHNVLSTKGSYFTNILSYIENPNFNSVIAWIPHHPEA